MLWQRTRFWPSPRRHSLSWLLKRVWILAMRGLFRELNSSHFRLSNEPRRRLGFQQNATSYGAKDRKSDIRGSVSWLEVRSAGFVRWIRTCARRASRRRIP